MRGLVSSCAVPAPGAAVEVQGCTVPGRKVLLLKRPNQPALACFLMLSAMRLRSLRVGWLLLGETRVTTILDEKRVNAWHPALNDKRLLERRSAEGMGPVAAWTIRELLLPPTPPAASGVQRKWETFRSLVPRKG